MRKTSVLESELSNNPHFSKCYIHYGQEELKKYIQPAYLKVLLAFDKICRENNIFYTITAGTLLGAARNGKFIPWDDDIDVLVRSKDYWKIKSAIVESKMSDEYVFLTPFDVDEITVDGKFMSKTMTFGSVLGEKQIGRPIYLDVLSIENVPSKKSQINIKAFLSKILMVSYNSMRCTEKRDPLLNAMKHYSIELKLNLFLRKCIALPALILGKKNMLKLMFKINYCSDDNTEFVTIPFGAVQYKREICPRSVFSKSVDIIFEGHVFQAPIGYEKYLENRYGDWKTPPPLSEQGIKCFKRREDWEDRIK